MFQDLLTSENLLLIAIGAIVLIRMFVADRITRRAIARYARRLGLDQHVENAFKPTARIVIFAAGVVALLSFFGMPTE
jgi:hypothetical protein